MVSWLVGWSCTHVSSETQGMLQSATLATRNDIITSSDTLKNTISSSFPQRLDTATFLPRRSCTDMPSETQGMSHSVMPATRKDITTSCDILKKKSAHTALAVKACLLGGISYTKCSMTFVNIAIAISALAGGQGGPQKISHRVQILAVFS